MKVLSQKVVCALFVYDPDGCLRWRKSPSNNVPAGSIAGNINAYGHVIVEVNHIAYPVHRLVWIYHYGRVPDRKEITHLNHIRTDNCIENLVATNPSESKRNKKLYKSNSSGVPGVVYTKSRKRKNWRATISYERRRISLGYFDTKEEAIIARKNAEIRYGFHPNHGKRSPMWRRVPQHG